MKTDRELLELAAKVAGIPYKALPHSGSCWEKWNPLADDGDAFRLASKLGLCVIFHAVQVEYSKGNGEIGYVVEQSFRDTSSTRRAIVRAAAAIGESMK